jgi:type IV secretory pathway TrbF-like protein
MDETPMNGASDSPAESDVVVGPRRYFDGDETRYKRASDEAEAGENTILQWLRYLKVSVWVLLAISLGLLGMVVYLALRSQVDVKFVVQNDEGQFRILGWDQYDPGVGVMKRDLEVWLRCARSITTDRETHRRCWQRVPMFIKEESQCAMEVQDYVKQRQPDHQLYRKSVLVHDLQGSREPDGRWRFSWVERTYHLDHGRAGPLIDTTTWHAIIITTREHPKRPAQIQDEHETINPLGLLCTHLAWWK